VIFIDAGTNGRHLRSQLPFDLRLLR